MPPQERERNQRRRSRKSRGRFVGGSDESSRRTAREALEYVRNEDQQKVHHVCLLLRALSNQISSTLISAGDTPEIREAWPTETGRS